jgi:hypothetical protein
MPCPTCNFLKYDNVLCGSPAMRGQDYCYHHHRQMRDAMYGARAQRRRYEVRLDLPALDNFPAIHRMLSQVLAALAADTIDYRRASAMISALRFASAQLRNPARG